MENTKQKIKQLLDGDSMGLYLLVTIPFVATIVIINLVRLANLVLDLNLNLL